MPTTAYSLPVSAPSEVIWRIVRDCAELPQRHRPELDSVAIVERTSDGLLRLVHTAEGKWSETVSVNESRKTVAVDLQDNQAYEGRVVYEVLVPGPESSQPTPRLGIRLYWKEQQGSAAGKAEKFSAQVKAELLSMKHAAEMRAAQMAG